MLRINIFHFENLLAVGTAHEYWKFWCEHYHAINKIFLYHYNEASAFKCVITKETVLNFVMQILQYVRNCIQIARIMMGNVHKFHQTH